MGSGDKTKIGPQIGSGNEANILPGVPEDSEQKKKRVKVAANLLHVSSYQGLHTER